MQRIKEFLNQFPETFQIFDWEGNFLDCTEDLSQSLGIPKEQIIGKNLIEFVHKYDKEYLSQMFLIIQKEKILNDFEIRLVSQTGEEIWLMWLVIPIEKLACIIAIKKDISIQKNISNAFILQQQKYKSLFDNLPMGIAITNEKGKIIETNRSAREYFDIKDGESLKRSLNLRKYSLIQPNGAKIYPRKSSLMRALKEGQVIRNMELGLIKKNRTIWFDILATPIPLEGFGLAVAFVDISSRKEAEEKIAYLALYDQLTHLPNRNSFVERLFPIFEEAKRHENAVGILVIDLDNFKLINDSKGHDFGDTVIQSVAYRLRESIRVYDILSRQGGDEFTIALPDIANERDAALVCESILDALSQPFLIGGEQIYVNVSIGVALYPNDGKDSRTLLKNADSAMNLAKKQGKGNFIFFRQEMQSNVSKRLDIENSMRVALREEQFFLHFQPKISSATGLPNGVEALIRWNHPTRGMIPPDQFIPVAEETGMILPLGEWVIKKAIHSLRLWREEGIEGISMAINISTKQFKHERLISTLNENLRLYRVDAKDLEIEITESALMESPDAAIRILNEIKGMGASIAIDDFGTGYSSLGYLRRFPISCLKIDRSFVSDITSEKDSEMIVKAVANLAHNLGMHVVAEGVETLEQVALLKTNEVDILQGYHFSRPLANDDCVRFINSFSSKSN